MAGINYNSPIGNLWIEEQKNKVTKIVLVKQLQEEIPTSFLISVKKEIDEYFHGKRKEFSFPIFYNKGTDFQKKVWNALKDVPYGTTKTYKDIAEQIKAPKAYRAVGNACNKNPLLLVVPCHRIIGSNQSLGGFALGVHKKKILLDFEFSYL